MPDRVAFYAKKYGVPIRLARALIGQESGGNPRAHSPAGAVGLMQIHLPSHPNVTRQQAEDPEFALDYGFKLLAGHKARFGSWRLALAAYNAGPGAVARYDGVPPYGETQRYVRNILGKVGVLSGVEQPVAREAHNLQVAGSSPAPAIEQPSLEGLQALAAGRYNPQEQLAGLLSSRAESPALDSQDTGHAQTAMGVSEPSVRVPKGTKRVKGALREAFYDPVGAYDEGSFIPPIGGHSDHVHLSINEPRAMIAAISLAQRMGLSARENPYTDKVDPVHTNGSYHYRTFPGLYNGRKLGMGLDVSGDPKKMAAFYKRAMQLFR